VTEIHNDLEELMGKSTLRDNVVPLSSKESRNRGRPPDKAEQKAASDYARRINQFTVLSEDESENGKYMLHLFKIARMATDDMPLECKQMLQSLIPGMGYQMAYNMVLNRVEDRGRPVIESLRDEIKMGFWTMSQFVPDEYKATFRNRDIVKSLIRMETYDNMYDPLKDYFKVCLQPSWLTYSPFDLLCDHIEDRNGLAVAFLRKFLLGCVARILDGFQNYTLILQGAQGLGKSYLAQWLCSGGLTPYFQEGPIIPKDKDHRIRLGSRFIWASDEIEIPRNKQAGSEMKEFLTMSTINDRPPYAEFAVEMPRRCNIIGTTNDETILSDPTGSRRYLVLNLKHLGHGYNKIPIDDLWAEVLGWYRAGERPTLTSTEKAQQQVVNEAVQHDDDFGDYLRQNVCKSGPEAILSNESMREHIARRYDPRGSNEFDYYLRHARAVMASMGYESGRTSKIRGFKGCRWR
jgi:hypothetical protein